MSARSRKGLVALLACALGALAAATTFNAAASPPRLERLGSAPLLPAGAVLLGALPGSTPLHVTVTLRPRDPQALQAFATAVSTPGSSVYGQYVTPAQFAQRFGATPARIAAVAASLRAHGLNPGTATANGLSIPVSATAAAVEQAFSLSFLRVALPGHRSAIFPNAAPLLDASIAGAVQGVLGLSSQTGLRPLAVGRSAAALGSAALQSSAAVKSPAAVHSAARPHVATGGPQPCSAASSAASSQGAHTIDQIAAAYGLSGLYGAGDQGAGQTIALYELEPNDPADIAAFQSCYGTRAPVSYVQVDGGTGSGTGMGEAALDIELAVGLAPMAHFLVYQGPNSNSGAPGAGPYDTWSAIISQDRANVVSGSWGQCEALEGAADAASENSLFQEAAAQGQTIISASGDNGSEDCNQMQGLPNPSLAVDDPAAQPFVTGVGGTSLSAIGPRPTESTWNNGGNVGGLLGLGLAPGAGGGGISSLWPMPGYQSGAPGSLHVINSASSGAPCAAQSGRCRQVPDVSANADPSTGYIIYFNGSGSNTGASTGWQAIGGTSAAAPTWASVLALGNASSACHGLPIGFANPALYRAAASAYGPDFNDVTAGNNDFTGTNGGSYRAGAGYDMATGLGSANAASLVPSLCTEALRLPNPGPQVSVVGQRTSLALEASDAGRARLTYSASGLPAGLALDGATGLISGKPRATGVSTVRVTATDSQGGFGAASFTWTVVGRPRLSHLSLSAVARARPKLSLTITSGAKAPAIARVSVKPPAGLALAARKRHIAVTDANRHPVPFTVRVRHGALVITLGSASPTVRITIGFAAITARESLVAAVRHRRAPTLRLTVTESGTGAKAVRLGGRLKPR